MEFPRTHGHSFEPSTKHVIVRRDGNFVGNADVDKETWK